ncbi:MAG: hypothetical protein ABSA17_05645 [Rhabdochlamydiaceae bacterium]|jgi:hypothetical protein
MFTTWSDLPVFVWNHFSGGYGVGAASLVGAAVIHRQWGMVVAASFLAGIATNYPLITGRVQMIEMNAAVQAAAAIGLAVLHYCAPSAAPLYVPMICCALALSIMGSARKRAEVDKRLVEQNERMKALEKSFGETVSMLEAEVARCFTALASVEEVAGKKDQVDETLDKIDQELAERIKTSKERLEALALLCEGATPNAVIDRMKTIKTLTDQCEDRTREIQQLTVQLAGVLDDLSRDAALSKENLLRILEQLKKKEG